VFAADWAHQPYTGNPTALVLSPVNARSTIDGLITGARHTLDVYAEEVGDTQQEQLLIAAAKRGVKVRLVCTGAGAIKALEAGGVRVVVKKTPYIHAKAFIVDGAAMFLGSENISTTSLERNREMGLVLHDPAALRVVEQVFAQDYGGSSTPVTPAGRPTRPTPPSASGGKLTVSVNVSPNPIPYGAYPTATIHTAAGAVCAISVRYASGRGATSYPDHATTADSSGTITEQGTWHMESKSAGGVLSATCTSKGTQASGSFAFQIS